MPVSALRRWKLGEKKFNTSPFGVSKNGELTIRSGNHTHSVDGLAKQYGTPLEVFLPEVATDRVRAVIQSFNDAIRKESYAGTFSYHYPMKVNQRKEYVTSVLNAGAEIETSSANELMLVRGMIRNGEARADLHIHCNGPKTSEYLDLIRRMYREGFSIVPIIEDAGELAALGTYSGKVGIRVDLSVKVDSHWDKKFNRFGFPEKDLRALGTIPNLSILSYHISSQIEGIDGFVTPIRQAMKLYADMKIKNPGLETLNIGGGAGIPYEKKSFYTTEKLAAAIVSACKKESARLGVPSPHIMCEWGRHVIAPAQISVFRIIGDKPIGKGMRGKWYVIDGSFIANLPDTWSLHQRWHITPVNRLRDATPETVWLAGSSCDSDDEYVPEGGQKISMPALKPGTNLYIAVFDTGAYQDSLASYHCLLSHPTRISLQEGSVAVLRKKEDAAEIGALFGW